MDLSTDYLGIRLASPLVASASPLSRDVGGCRALEDAGASAIVLYSLFEEEIDRESDERDRFLSHGADSYAESLTYFPQHGPYTSGPDAYLDHLARVKAAVKVPVIGSLNGVTLGGWVDWASEIERAGADAIELNVYYVAADTEIWGGEIEARVEELLTTVKRTVRIPVAVKLGPQWSAFAHFARRLDRAGADGLVLFNRFYQPDIDLETFSVVPRVELSSSLEARLAMRWIAILHGRIKGSLAATGGVHTAEDALKLAMVGADVTMLCSALLQHGPRHLEVVREGMARWLEEHEYESLRQMQGSMSQRFCPEPAAYERANYMKMLGSWK